MWREEQKMPWKSQIALALMWGVKCQCRFEEEITIGSRGGGGLSERDGKCKSRSEYEGKAYASG
jgi:hypothetical protein